MGTVVKVERFLEALPVRRQTALKTSAKTLSRMKRIMQAYAFTRPHLRLSLKISNAKNQKLDWKYPVNVTFSNPRVKPRSLDAIIDVMGKTLTSQCQYVHSAWSSAGEQIESVSGTSALLADQESAYTFEAVLAKDDCGKSMWM